MNKFVALFLVLFTGGCAVGGIDEVEPFRPIEYELASPFFRKT